MKLLLLTLLVGAAVAAPKSTELGFKNLYKKPIVDSKPITGRIINGQVAPAHSIPFQAFLEIYDRSGGWYCGGSLISTKTVLTAGHCAYEAVQGYITLGAQNPQQSESSQLVITITSANNFVVHPQFDMDEILYDIALINLPQTVTLNTNIQTVPLPTSAGDDYAGDTAKVSGWGLTDGKGNQISTQLRYVENPILSNQECSRIFGTIPDYQVCLSGEGGRSTCEGDSGGPLTVDGVQIGVVSYGVEDCVEGYPSGFTRTTSFLSWIADNSA